ncbi:MAG: alanine--tRNA ligase [Deltaproteobacteria bacterium]|nr:alanine--tRNA ligase [Deltaproteobacteria bacterium]
MKALTTAQIRRAFLDFFTERGHEEVPSSPLVPAHDPTLLFTNAGMVQFKDVFMGKETRAYQRATSSQRCLRAGGKHNDLEAVGRSPRHHTFFEMLGNFSFGDYFKKDAIEFAWSLLLNVFELPPERLCVTVFAGEGDIPADEEAAELWRAIGVPAERIFRCGKHDNYWQMGDTGPQGPCTEIHYFMPNDMTDALVQRRVEQSDGWMEIWNLVFMQFMKEAEDAPLAKLPRPCVDTGAGLERLAVVLQNKTSNYDTDLFQGLLGAIADDIKKPYGSASEGDKISMRVIADHARAATFLIGDGVMPDRDGRGYVLRRIMRRAIRHGKRLGFDDLFFDRACQAVIREMKEAYPDLERASSLIEEVARREETAFRRTLDRGLKLLDERFASVSVSVSSSGPKTHSVSLPADIVAELYDTYGFPIDLTNTIAQERGFTVDEAEAMEEVRRRQAKGANADLSKVERIETLWFELRDALGATKFTGYSTERGEAKLLALVKDGVRVDTVRDAEKVGLIFDVTPFYGESGGQVGDTGTAESTARIQITDTLRPLPEIVVHWGDVRGEVKVGETFKLIVDAEKRARTRKNHSATHLLHLALKEVLGTHVQQKGSLVAPDRLRFDFAHFESLRPEQVRAVEERVNAMIQRDDATVIEEVSIEDARKSGAVMLFGEKYGDRVRTVSIGGESLELCGGVHVARAGEIGFFKIVSDASIASGVRRIEAVTGPRAVEWVQTQEQTLREAAALMKAAPEQLSERIEKLLRRTKELERQLEDAQTKAALGTQGASSHAVETIAGIPVLFHKADGTPKKSLRPLADRLRDQLKRGVVVLSAVEEDKVALLVAATPDMAGTVHAGDLVKAASAAMDGSGGGRADFAQGGGVASKEADGLEALRKSISSASA